MTNTREFIRWYNNEFKFLPLWEDMEVIAENSPYHREASVATHTDMVVMTLLGLQLDTAKESYAQIMALFAAAFHDVGKPSMRIEKNSEDRGDYYAYHGHELRSARLWQDYFMHNRQMFCDRFAFGYEQFYTVSVMIEKHRPWGMKDVSKIHGIFQSLGTEDAIDEYMNLLYSDNSGRIGDSEEFFDSAIDNIEYFGKVREPITSLQYDALQQKLNLRKKLKIDDRPAPQLVIPISQAGSGKSTLFKKLLNMDHYLNPTGATFYSHSMDTIRAERYGPDDDVAFKLSTNDPEFSSAVQKNFIDLVRDNKSVYVDNTNLSIKRRNFYIAEAKKRGYDITAILIPLSLAESIERNGSRTNKFIPSKVIIDQYMSLSMPIIGKEFDRVLFVD